MAIYHDMYHSTVDKIGNIVVLYETVWKLIYQVYTETVFNWQVSDAN